MSKGQAKQMKTSLLWQLNAIPLHRHQKRVSMAIERKQFRFSGIEYHKQSVTPFTIIHRSNSSSLADSTFWNRVVSFA